MRIVCLSDTHNYHRHIQVPEGDILIHAGDFTQRGTIPEIEEFNQWLNSLPHRRKIVIAGNHDWLFETNNRLARRLLDDSIDYLQDSAIEIAGLKIYGSPWQPRFFDWAFNLNRGSEIAEKWKLIPDDTDILITHGPPHGILDEVPRRFGIENTGCEELMKKIEKLAGRKKLKLNVFGHIHGGYGQREKLGAKFVNASNCNEDYDPLQLPIVVDL